MTLRDEAGERDETLFGWDDTEHIVSVWADRSGVASTWRREGDRVLASRERYRPWIYATFSCNPDARGDVLCEELEGEPGSYRWFVSARTWDDLERAVISAAKRDRKNVHKLRDLGDEIYQAGSVEQFLMQSGRTYFGGLSYGHLARMAVDLETTALDPNEGRIFMAAIKMGDFETALEAPHEDDEPRLIEELLSIVSKRDPDVVENHNLFGFDLPFLASRAARFGIRFALGRNGAIAKEVRAPGRGGARGQLRYRAEGRELLDTMDAVRRYDFVVRELPSHGLKDVAKHFGVATPTREYVKGSEVYGTYLRDPSRVRRYALDDVREVAALSERLFPATFELAKMAPRRFSELAAAGPAMGVLEPLLVRAYVREKAALPPREAHDSSMPPHEGGAVHLFATGVAERVVKADVASLYPSLMRAFSIAPKRDAAGVFLRAVKSLLALRLHHKSSAKRLPKGSPEASHHDALQAAMKLMINSAYGYLGAGGMALFADRAAADEITRRGRELLSEVIEALRSKGATLLEADTDGVYFAVREGTTEEEERAMVTFAGERLPEGVHLEFEGRYRAMLSYEVKNYALLGYDGKLALRGVALRSSRSERFGEAFLEEAIARLLRKDVVGVRECFARVVERLRRREIPTFEVTTKVRITKGPEEYRRTRSSHREAPYEALLAANRVPWAPGERVRYYRSKSRGYVYFADDDSLADPRDYDVEHYLQVLVRSYASRLAPAFRREDWELVFRTSDQMGLFDPAIATLETRLMGES